jgi:hypothetical protein
MARDRRTALAVGGGGAIISAIAWWTDPLRFYPSWLFAWWFFLGIALGSLVNIMIHELTGGVWGFAIRRPLEASVGTLPWLSVLALPLVFGVQTLFPWARQTSSDVAASPHWYLNVPFFAVRAAIYFTVWIALAVALRRLWKLGATNAAERPVARLRVLAIAGLIAYATTITLATVDWIMSLSAGWYSTAFGFLTMIDQALSAFVFAVLRAARSGDIDRYTKDAAHATGDLGNILLTYVMLWAYIAFTQFLIIWATDLPKEIGWYLERARPAWTSIAVIVFTLQFAVPFVAMLFRSFKRNPQRLAALCAVVLAAHALETLWLVAPSVRGDALWIDWTDIAAFIAVGGLWFAAFVSNDTDVPAISAPSPSPPGVVEHG